MRLRLAAAVCSAIPGAPGICCWLPTSLVAGTAKLPGQRPGRCAIRGQSRVPTSLGSLPEKIHTYPLPGLLTTREADCNWRTLGLPRRMVSLRPTGHHAR